MDFLGGYRTYDETDTTKFHGDFMLISWVFMGDLEPRPSQGWGFHRRSPAPTAALMAFDVASVGGDALLARMDRKLM